MSSFSRSSKLRMISRIVDFSVAAWNTVGKHELFKVRKGLISNARLYVRNVVALAGGAGAAMRAGDAADTTRFYASATIATRGVVADKIWSTTTEVLTTTTDPGVVRTYSTEDVGYEITVNALTSGQLEFTLLYEQLGDDCEVSLGAGGTL